MLQKRFGAYAYRGPKSLSSNIVGVLLCLLGTASASCVSGRISGESPSDGVNPASGGKGGSAQVAGAPGTSQAVPSSFVAGAAHTVAAQSYSLVVDTPRDQSSVQGNVQIAGRVHGFSDVEVWDSSGASLGQAVPDSKGAFDVTVDTSDIPQGATTWTVNAFDGPHGQSYQRSAQVELALSIAPSTSPPAPSTNPALVSCAGETCSGHGACAVVSAQAVCQCEGGYHASGLSCQPGSEDPGSSYVPAGYHLSFSDEFSDGKLDATKWNTRAPWNVQWYSDSHQMQAFIPEAVVLHDGIVSFVADHSQGNTAGQPYASGSITTQRSFTYGYFETRVSLPAGKGFWPAYWLTSSVRWPPELDIFEVIDGVDYGYTHIVSGGAFSNLEGAAGPESKYALPNAFGVYHVYGFRWTATDLYRYVDGVLTEHDAVDAAAGSGDPFWLNLSLQVGGDWPGSPDAATPFPAQMDIDYVRVYEQ